MELLITEQFRGFMKKLLTIQETSELLSVSTETLRRWDNEGKLKAVRVGSRRGVGDRRYRQKDIEEYLKENSKQK